VLMDWGPKMKWEELTADQFRQAVIDSQGVCLLPLGVIEKHGPHLPLGTDLLAAREISLRAAALEPAVVFPEYYLTQILEAKHQPGTIAIGARLMMELLETVCAEIARNGLRKILIYNGHGGNENLLRFFIRVQLESSRDYVIYLATPRPDPEFEQKVKAIRQTEFDHHAGEFETSWMMAIRPDLVKLKEASKESGARQGRLDQLGDAHTAMGWYSNFPNHYAGDGQPATADKGKMMIEHAVTSLVEVIREVKADQVTGELQREFFRRAQDPLAK